MSQNNTFARNKLSFVTSPEEQRSIREQNQRPFVPIAEVMSARFGQAEFNPSLDRTLKAGLGVTGSWFGTSMENGSEILSAEEAQKRYPVPTRYAGAIAAEDAYNTFKEYEAQQRYGKLLDNANNDFLSTTLGFGASLAGGIVHNPIEMALTAVLTAATGGAIGATRLGATLGMGLGREALSSIAMASTRGAKLGNMMKFMAQNAVVGAAVDVPMQAAVMAMYNNQLAHYGEYTAGDYAMAVGMGALIGSGVGVFGYRNALKRGQSVIAESAQRAGMVAEPKIWDGNTLPVVYDPKRGRYYGENVTQVGPDGVMYSGKAGVDYDAPVRTFKDNVPAVRRQRDFYKGENVSTVGPDGVIYAGRYGEGPYTDTPIRVYDESIPKLEYKRSPNAQKLIGMRKSLRGIPAEYMEMAANPKFSYLQIAPSRGYGEGITVALGDPLRADKNVLASFLESTKYRGFKTEGMTHARIMASKKLFDLDTPIPPSWKSTLIEFMDSIYAKDRGLHLWVLNEKSTMRELIDSPLMRMGEDVPHKLQNLIKGMGYEGYVRRTGPFQEAHFFTSAGILEEGSRIRMTDLDIRAASHDSLNFKSEHVTFHGEGAIAINKQKVADAIKGYGPIKMRDGKLDISAFTVEKNYVTKALVETSENSNAIMQYNKSKNLPETATLKELNKEVSRAKLFSYENIQKMKKEFIGCLGG